MVSFRANLISQEYIFKNNGDNSYSRQPVSFVRINDNSKNEVHAIRETVNSWAYGDEYGKNISDCLLETFYSNVGKNENKYFAITKQTENLEELNPKDILALALTSPSENGEECVDYVQVEPKYVSTLPEYVLGAKQPFYGKIGSAIFDGIENLFKDKDITVFTLKNTINFYKKRGYKTKIDGQVSKMLLKH